jgi:hypothetical protein
MSHNGKTDLSDYPNTSCSCHRDKQRSDRRGLQYLSTPASWKSRFSHFLHTRATGRQPVSAHDYYPEKRQRPGHSSSLPRYKHPTYRQPLLSPKWRPRQKPPRTSSILFSYLFHFLLNDSKCIQKNNMDQSIRYPSVKVCMKATMAASSSWVSPRFPSSSRLTVSAYSGAGYSSTSRTL